MSRSENMEKLLDELALVVDGDRDAIARHADFLADDDEARDLKHDAALVAERLARAGADYVPPADLETRVLAALDARGSGTAADREGAESGPMRDTSPGFVIDPHARTGDAGLRVDAGRALDAGLRGDAGRGAEAGSASPGAREIREASTVDRSDAGALDAVQAPRADGHRDGATVAMFARPDEASASVGSGTSSREQTECERVEGERLERRGRKVLFGFAALGIAAAAVAALAIVPAGIDDGELARDGRGASAIFAGATTGRITRVAGGASAGGAGLEIRAAGGAWQPAGEGTEIPAGAEVRTDERTRARIALSDGSEMVLNHSTELRFDPRAARRFELPSGEVLADVAHRADAPNLAIAVPTGRIEVLGTKFVLSATEQSASVRVTRGTVRVHGGNGNAGITRDVKAGEEGVLRADAAPEVAPVMDLARSLEWSELSSEVDIDDAPSTLPGIGSLRARRPGEREDRERPLTLARHEVRVRIVGNVARTEIEEVFRNDSDHTLEGIYRFPLPSDARIARLALDVNGTMEEGAFVARERAQRIWRGVIRNATPVAERRPTEELIWVPGPWRDPALLEWQRGGQFELRIFPIPAHGERRVVIAYTQTIAPRADGRRYVYPLAHSADDSLRIGEFSVDVRVANAERVTASGYQIRSASDEDATRLSFEQTGFLPNGDLVIDYQLPGGERELSFWTYQGDAAQAPPERSRDRDREVVELQRQLAADSRPYVAFALRPELPVREEGRMRDYVIVVDSSQSMVGERFQRASRLVAGVIAEMDRRDRFTVLVCDYECRSMEGMPERARLRVPSAGEAREVSEWLARVEPAGASDLVATLRTAAGVVSQREPGRSVHVIYVGDGVASVGHRSTAALSSEAERLSASARVAFTTVGIGSDADATALATIARSGGGHYVPFVPGQRAAMAALSVLETTYGVALRDAHLELPAGLVEVAPERLPTIRAGEEVIVTARMSSSAEVSGEVVLRGTVGGEPFEQRYPVRLVPSTAAGNRFVPALWAALRIEQLEQGGRGEDEARIVAMSKAYSVMSRHTSLLVLESEAMFRAFGIDRASAPVAQWTGEDDVEGGSAEGTLALPGRDSLTAAVDDVATGTGSGYGAAGRAGFASAERRARASAPMRSSASAPAPLALELEAPSRDEFDRAWRERSSAAAPAAGAPMWPPAPSSRRGPGRWMRRVFYRVGEIQSDGTPTFREQEQARLADERLAQQPDSRDRHRAAVRALARAGNLERALEVAEAWFSRDRLDPEALVARADVLARMGRRDEALRLLTGVVDVRPDDAALHTRLAGAFERAGDLARACAHRVSLAEIRSEDASAVADAVRCERSAGNRELAQLLLDGVRDARARARAASAADAAASTPRVRGELLIEASWPGGDDVDVAIIAPDGSRLSWMGGRTTIVGEGARRDGRETIGLSRASVGNYLVEVTRTTPDEDETIRGTLRIRALDATRTIPFVIDRGTRSSVARVVVQRMSRMEAVW